MTNFTSAVTLVQLAGALGEPNGCVLKVSTSSSPSWGGEDGREFFMGPEEGRVLIGVWDINGAGAHLASVEDPLICSARR